MDISQTSKQFELEKEDLIQKRLGDFYRKPVSIKVTMKRSLLGFVDFRNEDFLKTSIESSDQKKIVLEFGREILLSDICKIEERLNQEVRRRKKVVRIFPNVDSANRLIGSVLMHIHEEWITSSRAYMRL